MKLGIQLGIGLNCYCHFTFYTNNSTKTSGLHSSKFSDTRTHPLTTTEKGNN